MAEQSGDNRITDNQNSNTDANSGAGGADGAGKVAQPPYEILVQYVKDISVEAPNLPIMLREHSQLVASMDIDIATNSLGGKDVELVLTFSAKAEEAEGGRLAYQVEITYGSVIRFHNVAKDVVPSLLLVEAPHQIFPSIRSLFMNLVRDCGFQPPMLRPVNFLELARVKASKAQQANPAS